jgi:hypothetical protein
MSWAVFWNFLGEPGSQNQRQDGEPRTDLILGAGLLALLVPRGLQWGQSRLFGLFA